MLAVRAACLVWLALAQRPSLSRQSNPKRRPPSHYLWAALIARIYEVFPLLCPVCGGQMRIILETAVGRARVGCDGVRWQG